MKKLVLSYKSLIELLPFRKWSLAIIAVNIFVIMLTLAVKDILPPSVPLYYGRPYGVEQLSSQGNLVIPPIVAIIICVINISINLSLEKEEFAEKVLFGSMIVATLLSAVTVIKIIFLVGNI